MLNDVREIIEGQVALKGSLNVDGVTVLFKDSKGNVLICAGGTVPSTKAGYSVGCEFINTSTGKLYQNIGTAASCDFNIIGDVSAGEITLAEGSLLIGNVSGVAAALDGKTDGRILVGNGTTMLSVAISGDITLSGAGAVAIASGVIIDADVNASAAIAYSKLATLPSGNLLVGSAGGVATVKAITGVITVDANGLTALTTAASPFANLIADPGTGVAIPVTASGVVAITTAAAETNTLANPPSAGMLLAITCNVYAVGDRVITAATAINQAGNTIMTFGAARDTIVLYSTKVAGGFVWQVLSNDGVALS